MHWLGRRLGWVVGSLSLACAATDEGPLPLPEPSRDAFVATVYPVLLRDCGFPGCHGTHARFFQVFGPGRTRLDPVLDPHAPATPGELSLSFSRARSMLTPPDLLLLRKPLAIAEGGAGHEGDDAWERAVYQKRTEPGYLALEAWLRAAGAAQ